MKMFSYARKTNIFDENANFLNFFFEILKVFVLCNYLKSRFEFDDEKFCLSIYYYIYSFYIFLFTFNRFFHISFDSTLKSIHSDLQHTFNDSFENRSNIREFLEIKARYLEIFLRKIWFRRKVAIANVVQ
jgi:hypothetical protein